MSYAAFIARRDALRRARPELVDCAELNLYRSLAPRFAPIAPSTHPEAPFRCHLAEQLLDVLGLPRELKARTQVSHGVRRSLGALFSLLAEQGTTVAIPSDVYPVYFELASRAGVRVLSYEARASLPPANCDAALICEPLKPWGTQLTPADAQRLAAWAAPSRMLIIDSAYATPPSPAVLELARTDAAVVLVSLSKGWLIPDHAGLCIVPSRLQARAREAFAKLAKDEQRLRIGYAALTEHRGRPGEIAAILRERAGRLDELVHARGLAASRCVGYFATCEASFDELLDRGVLAVPASVFGSAWTGSVLSSLGPA